MRKLAAPRYYGSVKSQGWLLILFYQICNGQPGFCCPFGVGSSSLLSPGASRPVDCNPHRIYHASMLTVLVYIALIAGINWAFDIVPPLQLPGGDLWSPVALIVGFVFVVRDYAQRQVGHNILWAMLAGIAISWWMASPQLAMASAAAFAIGELADWALYTFTNKPFSQRILISSCLGAPLDSLVFLFLIGLASPTSVGVMSFSKLLGALVVFLLVRRREKLETMQTAA